MIFDNSCLIDCNLKTLIEPPKKLCYNDYSTIIDNSQ